MAKGRYINFLNNNNNNNQYWLHVSTNVDAQQYIKYVLSD